MKKNTVLLSCLLFFSCLNNELPSDCLRPLNVVINKSLDSPELSKLLTTDNFVEIVGGYKGIVIFRLNNDDYFAFDKICPKNNCTNPMTVNNDFDYLLTCVCDESEYAVRFGGASQTEGFPCPALQYNTAINGRTITISN